MKKVDYIQSLTEEDRIRISFTQDKGKITRFVVQYLALINSRWRTIMRIDNCHGCPHQHVFHLHSKEFVVTLEKDNNPAFTEAQKHIITEFRKIKENFIFSR